EHGKRVRIFTVAEELPFAGHPTLGTAFVLRGSSRVPEIRLELNVGLVPVRFEEADGEPAFGEMTQIEPEFGGQHDREAVVKAIGLGIEDLDPELPVETEAYLSNSGGKFFYFVCRETVDPEARLHARMLFYGGEDPATGSAAGCAASWMVAHGVAEPDERVLIEQGIEMKRPSRIFVRASKNGNRVVNVRVGGNAVEVMRGEFFF
ncbi:MAG: PhzF family phenazine biosynthesis protein, partial [Acidobacteria bacterium]